MIHSETLAPQDVALYALVLLIVAIVAVVFFLWLRGRARAAARTGTHGDPAGRDDTLVLHPNHRPQGGDDARRAPSSFTVFLPDDDGTYLVPLVDDAGTPGQPIRVQARSLDIGRDATRAQIVFTDTSVSRLHARLVEEADGVFMLHDEGSASGTFVNDERVALQPRRLKSGDMIEFGRQRVIFESAEQIGDVAAVAAQG